MEMQCFLPQTPNIFVISWELVGKECTFPVVLGRGAWFMGCDGERGRGPLGRQEAKALLPGRSLPVWGKTCLITHQLKKNYFFIIAFIFQHPK